MLRAISGLGRFLGVSKRSDASDEERRLWGRIPCHLETTIAPANGRNEPELPARVRNISRSGINLTVGRSFAAGTLLSVALPLDAGTEMLVCVVRCEPVTDGGYELGCTFAAQLSDEDLHHFGARREKTVAPDLRSWVRYPCHAQVGYRVVKTESTNPATVLNISASGIALEVNEALRVGELLELALSRDGEVLLTTLASVVRTEMAPDRAHVIGCNFIAELTEEQVATLL
jgi:hypothetical protein